MLRSFLARLWDAVFHPTSRLPVNFPWTAGKMAKTYGIALVFYLVGSLVPVLALIGALFFLASHHPEALDNVLNNAGWAKVVVGTSIVSFLTGFGMELWYLRRSMHQDGLRLRDTLALNLNSLGGSWLAALWRALSAFALVVGAQTLLALFLPPVQDPAASLAQQVTGGHFLALALLMVVAAPFFEELVFRGFLFGTLRSSFRRGLAARLLGNNGTAADYSAALLSAFVFGLAHMNLSGLVFYMVLGFVSAEMYRRTGSLIPSMLLHAVNNLMGVAVLMHWL